VPTSRSRDTSHDAPGARRPPSVHAILEVAAASVAGRDRAAVRSVLADLLTDERRLLSKGSRPQSAAELAAVLDDRLRALPFDAPMRVINASGVILHTNLGRAPWAREATDAAVRAAGGYLFLELDADSGRRAGRFPAVESHLVQLTGADAALVVNNNAAAVALCVSVLGRRAAVVVSRGELAEIGGGVRIPEIIRRAGARLVEVGTTNRTRLTDYERALDDHRVGALLRVHASNFRIEGFTERPALHELAELAQARGVPLVEDLGSGALVDTARFGIAHEPLPQESVAAGVDLVTFSGDKLLGGPQAGLIVGRAELVTRLRRDPLTRAVRPDKVTLAALSATLGLYRSGEAEAKIPIWRMIAAPMDELRRRAERLASALREARVAATVTTMQSTLGGGSLPGELLPSVGLSIGSQRPDRLHRALRIGEPAVIGRVQRGELLLDLRTVLPDQDDAVVQAVRHAAEAVP
jgi:L-seryl-tRNA(Ser) seleniumtransferase